MCVLCRRRQPKAALTRVYVSGPASARRLVVDSTGKGPGRGAYVCGCVAEHGGRAKGLTHRLAAALGATGNTIDTTELVAWARQRTENADVG